MGVHARFYSCFLDVNVMVSVGVHSKADRVAAMAKVLVINDSK